MENPQEKIQSCKKQMTAFRDQNSTALQFDLRVVYSYQLSADLHEHVLDLSGKNFGVTHSSQTAGTAVQEKQQ